MPLRIHLLLSSVLLAAACAAPGAPDDPRLRGPSATDLSRMMAPAAVRRIAAASKTEIADAAEAAARVADPVFQRSMRMKQIEISAIPYLRRSTEGAHFLQAPPPRALARGDPAHLCPAAAVGFGANPRAATAAALEACLDHVPAGGACGCRILAVDNLLTAPPSAFVFAPAVTAHLIDTKARRARTLIAESEPPEGRVERVLLRDAAGVVGRVTMIGRSARLILAGDAGGVAEGVREPFGYRRGRLAERISFTRPDGGRLTLLIGVERRDALASN